MSGRSRAGVGVDDRVYGRLTVVNDASIGHACGVFGVYAPGQPVAHLTYLGLYACSTGARSRPASR